MATYNGERFLQEQLDSLAWQTHLPCELVVGDDGSTDGTLDILERFAETAPFPVHITRNPVNLGYGENFLQTASRCTGDWIAFCDQDDVWRSNKLDRAKRILERNPVVQLFVHEMTACDERLKRTASHVNGLWISRKVAPFGGRYRTFAGCSMIVRKDLFDAVNWTRRPEFVDGKHQHDAWIGLVAFVIGQQYWCRESLALYRRHERAITSGYTHGFIRKISRIGRTPANVYVQASDYYLKLEKWFSEHTDNIEPNYRSAFLAAARLFGKRARVYKERAKLYGANTTVKRIRVYSKLAIDREYLLELTLRDYVKDLLRVITPWPILKIGCPEPPEGSKGRFIKK